MTLAKLSNRVFGAIVPGSEIYLYSKQTQGKIGRPIDRTGYSFQVVRSAAPGQTFSTGQRMTRNTETPPVLLLDTR